MKTTTHIIKMTKKETCAECWEKCKKKDYFRKCIGCSASFCDKCAAKELLWTGCACKNPCFIGHGWMCKECRQDYDYEYVECNGDHFSKVDHDKYW